MGTCDPSSLPAYIFHEDLVMKYLSSRFSFSAEIKRNICQFVVKKYAPSSDNLPLGGLPRHCQISIAADLW